MQGLITNHAGFEIQSAVKLGSLLNGMSIDDEYTINGIQITRTGNDTWDIGCYQDTARDEGMYWEDIIAELIEA